ncbi:MAG: hypothetical protein NUV97_04155 [archaeon]|nr:hypothetical protein [archaeon]MCR4323557.1 hypothetical protein [Nanoarchaeota archaeon]
MDISLPEIEQDTIHFNNELLFAEIGGLIASPIFGYIAFHLKPTPDFISFFAVLGSIIGCAVFWLVTRVRNHKKRGCFSTGKIAKDMLYYTPVASFTAFMVYQPTLFMISSHLLETGHGVWESILIAQLLAFLLFGTIINIYRYFLEKFTGRRL